MSRRVMILLYAGGSATRRGQDGRLWWSEARGSGKEVCLMDRVLPCRDGERKKASRPTAVVDGVVARAGRAE